MPIDAESAWTTEYARSHSPNDLRNGSSYCIYGLFLPQHRENFAYSANFGSKCLDAGAVLNNLLLQLAIRGASFLHLSGKGIPHSQRNQYSFDFGHLPGRDSSIL